MISTQYITLPTDIEEGFNRKLSPITKKIIAAASQGFQTFHAHTANLWLKTYRTHYIILPFILIQI